MALAEVVSYRRASQSSSYWSPLMCSVNLRYLISIPQETQTEFHKFNTKISVQNIYTFQNIRNSHFKIFFSKWHTQGNIRQGCLNHALTGCFLRPASAFVNYEYICYNIRIVWAVGGTRWRSWLRHCATNWKVADSIPHGVTVIFHWHNPSTRTLALGLTQLLTEMSTRSISWVKAAGA
jgi:hypothetical protein